MSNNAPLELAVAWSGLPPYAAYCLAELRKQFTDRMVILGTKADVPHQGLEEMVGDEIYWVDRHQQTTWQQLGLTVPKHFVHTGWAYPAFNSLGNEVQRAGGSRHSMIDSIWKNRLKQVAGLLRFRLQYRRWFDTVMVPGKTGRSFCNRMGMPHDRIFEGLYGANPDIFRPGPPLGERPKRMIFVGRLIDRKGIPQLMNALESGKLHASGWEMLVVGEGEHAEALRNTPGVRLEPFSTPDQIAEWMRESRFLVLPSVEENWGVVVHEATCSGCGVILAENVGAAEDLCCPENGFLVDKSNADQLAQAMHSATELDSKELERVRELSLEKAALFGPMVFAEQILKMIEKIYE